MNNIRETIMCYVSDIRREVDQINREYLVRTPIVFNEKLNINEVMNSLINLTNHFYEVLKTAFMEINKEDYDQVKEDIKTTTTLLKQFYTTIKLASKKGIICDNIEELKESIEDLEEIGQDLKTFRVDLINDKEYKDLISKINDL